MKRGKKYLEAAKKVDTNRKYSLEEAIRVLKEIKHTKFDESMEVAVRLGVDPRHADQQVRGTVVLPHGTGKKVRVLVFAKGDKVKEAEQAGADYSGGDDLMNRIKGGWLEFDVAVATPDMMREISKLGKILGPRGLMPSPKSGTVTNDIAGIVKELKAGKIEFRVDRGGIVHSAIGKLSFDHKHLEENAQAFLDAVVKAKPPGAKGQYVRSVCLSSTMSPGVIVEY